MAVARSKKPPAGPAIDPKTVFTGEPGNTPYLSRELSWLAFNDRVLEEANDASNPLCERARFLAIVMNNMDEFVQVRYAELHATIKHSERDPAGYTPRQVLEAVRVQMRKQCDAAYACWSEQLEPAIATRGVVILKPHEWTESDRETIRVHFRDTLEPILTPLAVDPTRPFPLLTNRALHLAVQVQNLEKSVEASDSALRALVSIPQGKRLVALVGREGTFALVEDVVAAHVGRLFPGYSVTAVTCVRITRDGSIDVEEENAADFLSEIEEELRQRGHGEAVRLELTNGAPEDLIAWLVERLELRSSDVISVPGPLDLTMLFALAGLKALSVQPDLNFPPHDPLPCPYPWDEPWDLLRTQDVLLHHPYESFSPVVKLVEKAAEDPGTLAIKMTLYRVSGDSPIVRALMKAAMQGKQVTVLVELRARFDEASNITWARKLEQAGAHVIYGLIGLKVHAKLMLIIRREPEGIRRYVQLGTGNYNDKTARMYSDFSYITANEAVGRDVAGLFNMLTGFSQPPAWERLAVAPLTMRTQFTAWIQREAEHARAGRGGQIIAKFNSLVDVGIVDELYLASQAGVKITLIVRGMCVLRPGVKGISDNIRVISVIGRFLEHSRLYYFANHGDPVLAIASADWMTRNLDKRVESLVRITDATIRKRLMHIVELMLSDDYQAREGQANGTYIRRKVAQPAQPQRAQELCAAEARQHALEVTTIQPESAPIKPRRGFQPLTSKG